MRYNLIAVAAMLVVPMLLAVFFMDEEKAKAEIAVLVLTHRLPPSFLPSYPFLPLYSLRITHAYTSLRIAKALSCCSEGQPCCSGPLFNG